MTRGDAYLVSMPLPGVTGGGKHLSVLLSSAAYHAGGHAVIAPLRKVAPAASRPAVYQPEFRPIPGAAMPLDRDRVLDLAQAVTVPLHALGARAGRVAPEAMARVDAAIPAHFQFAGPWEIRGAIWTLTPDAPVARAVLVMNDAALEHAFATHYTALELRDDGRLGDRLLMLHPDWLDEEAEAPLDDAAQDALDAFLAGALDVARGRLRRAPAP